MSSFTSGAGLEPQELVVERRVAAAHGFQPIEEVEHDLGQRQFELDLHLPAGILHSLLLAALLDAELNDRAEILLRHENARENDRLADLAGSARLGQIGGVLHLDDFVRRRLDLVDDRRRRRDQRKIVLALEPLLDDLHVQQTQETAAHAEAERCADLGLERERRVVQGQLLQGLAKLLVVLGHERKQAGEYSAAGSS